MQAWRIILKFRQYAFLSIGRSRSRIAFPKIPTVVSILSLDVLVSFSICGQRAQYCIPVLQCDTSCLGYSRLESLMCL